MISENTPLFRHRFFVVCTKINPDYEMYLIMSRDDVILSTLGMILPDKTGTVCNHLVGRSLQIESAFLFYREGMILA